MKFVIPILFLFSCPAPALTCVHGSAALQLSVYRTGDQLKMVFSAGRGYSSIPQIEGPVSENDLPMMRFQLETLRELGRGFQITVPVAACDLSQFEDGKLACYFEGQIEGTHLTFSSLTAFRSTQSHVSGDFEIQHFRMIIGNENRFFFVVPFPATYCK